MARDPLGAVRTIRERAVDRLRRDLAACLAAEAAVAARIAELDRAVQRDRAAHGAVEDPHRFQDMFAARRAAGEADRVAAVREHLQAAVRSEDVRAALVAARVAAEAVGAVIAERATARAIALGRREQLELEEAARSRKRSMASGC
ncbi:MAG TPA: hypothetical protein DDZ81_05565 [Acetobacteraceae bacterium]|jgi:hypothetical protein|nr:hypothetical protein [Acetobacteraceae bacterium]